MLEQRWKRSVEAMKNSSRVWATLLMIPLIIAVCALSIRSTASREEKGETIMYGTAQLRNEIRIPVSEADNLEVLYTSKNIYVYPAKTDEIVIKEYLLTDREDAKATVSRSETTDGKRTVTVAGAKNQIISIFYVGVGERIEVYLPKEAVSSLHIETKSGNIRSEEEGFALKAKEVHVHASSGNILWGNTKAQEIVLGTSSGNIKTWNMTGNMNTQASSGNITIEEFAGSGSAKANSGNVRVAVQELTGNLELQTSSGNVKAELPRDAAFIFEAQTGSGKIRTDFEDKVAYNTKGNQASAIIGNQPSVSVKAGAGSGNVTISYS